MLDWPFYTRPAVLPRLGAHVQRARTQSETDLIGFIPAHVVNGAYLYFGPASDGAWYP